MHDNRVFQHGNNNPNETPCVSPCGGVRCMSMAFRQQNWTALRDWQALGHDLRTEVRNTTDLNVSWLLHISFALLKSDDASSHTRAPTGSASSHTAVPSSPPSVLPSPSCMLNNESCPIPRGWVADWSLVNSTAIMAIGARGYSPEGFAPRHRWGYVTLDWSTGWQEWIGTSPGADPAQTTCEATSSANCVRLKQRGGAKRCGICESDANLSMHFHSRPFASAPVCHW